MIQVIKLESNCCVCTRLLIFFSFKRQSINLNVLFPLDDLDRYNNHKLYHNSQYEL
jgi:hypothetical protein